MYIGTNVFLSILSYFDLFFFFFYRVSSGISSDWRTCRQRDPSKMGVLPRRFYLQTSASLGEHSPFFQTLLKLRISTETCSNRNLSILYIVLSLETYFFWSPALYTSPPPPTLYVHKFWGSPSNKLAFTRSPPLNLLCLFAWLLYFVILNDWVEINWTWTWIYLLLNSLIIYLSSSA